MNVNFKIIEDSFLQLLNSLSNNFSQSEIKEVQDFIDVGENGLALETLVGIVDEEDKNISNESLALIKNLAVEMSMDQKALVDKLQGHIV